MHPTGIDGLLRESNPNDFTLVSSSCLYLSFYHLIFPQPLSQQERFDAFKADLLEAYKLVDSQSSQASLQWLNNMKKHFKPGIKCVKDNLMHINQRTCPRTNERDHRNQPIPVNVIECMSFDKDDSSQPSRI